MDVKCVLVNTNLPNAQKIEQNIRARKAVQELLDTIPAIVDGIDEDRFWETLAREAAGRVGFALVPDGPAPRPMTYEEAIVFEGEPVPFMDGKRVSDLPWYYWLKLQESVFSKKLRRYVMSPRFRDLQEE